MKDNVLWQKIADYNVDNVDSELPFSQRLARENGWSVEYAKRVIEEFKKFCYLAMVSGHFVTPSDQVDQVWHLFLLYTQQYWGEYCPNILGRPFHHGPTKGGHKEGEKFHEWYENTKTTYHEEFGQIPPVDIWPPSEVRFGDIYFVRVSADHNYIIPHASPWKLLTTLFMHYINKIK